MADIRSRLREACVGHPHAKIPWPHRLDDGGPAFPCEGGSTSGLIADPGMSLRDWFAQSQPSDDLQDLSYHHLSPDARSLLAAEPMPERPRDSAPGEERVKYQLDKARWQAKVTAALRYMHADAMLAARTGTPKPDPRDELLREVQIAAATVLDGLNERIQEAPECAVPVFDGVAALQEVLTKIQKALGDD